MRSVILVKKIRNYAIVSFLVPLLTINLCLLIYKYLGSIEPSIFPNINWNQSELTLTYSEYKKYVNNFKSYTFTNCPINERKKIWTLVDNQTIVEIANDRNQDILFDKLKKNNKLKSVTIYEIENSNDRSCITNHQNSYTLIKKFGWFEKIAVRSIMNNPVGFSKIQNPYIYGEVSISRTARYFPIIFIFKPFIILSAFLLFFYWKNNLNLFNELKSKNILVKFSKKFFYFGIFSCIFLILHASFLGLDIDSKLFHQTRRLIIILFIFFEIFAQILLTKNLFDFKEKLEGFISPLVLKIKIVFVTTVFFITCVAFTILAFGEPSTAFKHTLEWNYFAFLLIYYLLSRFLWQVPKTQVHTPEGA